MKRLIAAFLLCLLPSLAHAASCASYPFTLQNNTTADATQVMADFNTVRNCVINNAASSGVNADITALTGLTTPLAVSEGGTPVFIGGTSSGSANAQSVASLTPTGFSLTSGYRVTFTAGFSNTSATMLDVNFSGPTAVNRLGPAGPEALTGGEIVAGNIIEAFYNGSLFVLLTESASSSGGVATRTSIATGATVDLGTVTTHNAFITSSGGTITSFGSTATVTAPVYLISFAGANTLTYNATSLIIPGAGNITTAANDTAVVEYLGTGNWQVLSYTKASGAPVVAILPVPAAFKNLAIKVASNTTVTVTADFVTLYDGTNTVTVPQSSTINLGTNGAVNTLDAGTIAIDTWYAIWVIYNGTTVGALASTSATAPTLPSGYTFKARVGWVKTIHGSATLYGTWQFGRRAQFVVGLAQTTSPVQIASGVFGTYSDTVPAWQSFTVNGGNVQASYVPSTASVIYILATNTINSGTPSNVIVAPNSTYAGRSANGDPPPIFLNSGAGALVTTSLLLESTAIFAASSASGGWVACMGWDDNI